MSMQPQRVDWTLSTTDRVPTAAQHVGELSELTALIGRLVEWVGLSELPTSRIAVGLTLVKPVSSREEGYVELDRLIPDLKLDVESSDFSYQINRCRASRVVPDQAINRLSNWSVQQVRFGVISSLADLSMTETAVSYGIRLVLDVNTVPSEGPLPADKLSAVTTELVELAREIAESGDIR